MFPVVGKEWETSSLPRPDRRHILSSVANPDTSVT